jgi:hypothetical protein
MAPEETHNLRLGQAVRAVYGPRALPASLILRIESWMTTT